MVGYATLKSKIFTTKNFNRFIDFVLNYKKAYIYAHNLAFDFRVILPFLMQREFEVLGGITESTAFFIRTRKDKKYQYWISTTNFFRVKLSQLGEIFGKNKKKIRYEEIGKSLNDKLLREYLIRDVEILRDVVRNLSNIENKYRVKTSFTASQLALRIFQKNYEYEWNKIHFGDNKKEFHNWYFGGRVEYFKLGKFKNVLYLDINSLYPFVGSKFPLPIKLVKTLNYIEDENEIKKLLNKYSVLAKVKVKTNKYIPPYPKKYKGKLIFPKGEFWVFLNTPEIGLAVKSGEFIKANDIYLFRNDYIFKGFFTDFYKLKKQINRNNPNYLFVKLILNSLTGKFGQFRYKLKTRKTKDFPQLSKMLLNIDNRTIIYKNKNIKILRIGDTLLIEEEREPSKFTFFPIISHITAFGRTYLWQFLNHYEKEVLYCDTDSLVLPKKIDLTHIPFGEELGKFKIEEEFKELVIKGLKNYEGITVNNKPIRKHKGVKKEAQKLTLWDTKMKQLIEVFEYKRFIGFKEQLRYYKLINPVIITVQKRDRRTLAKREIKGNLTFPISIYE